MNGTLRILIALFIIVLLSPLAGFAYGHHGYFRGGVWIDPLWGPWWFAPYPYYSAPPVVVERPTTDYYIQQAPQQTQEPAYWFYCRKSEGYYPYVQQCPEGWMKVVPTPPPQKKGE